MTRFAQRLNWLWRLLATGVCFFVFSAGGLVLSITAFPVINLLPLNKTRKQSVSRNIIRGSFKCFIQLMTLSGVMKWHIENREALEQKGNIIIANHPTLIDTIFLIAFTPDATCIVKNQIFNSFFLGSSVKNAGYIPNSEATQLIQDIKNELDAGSCLIIFPEGTRTQPGKSIKFQRGAANTAIRCSSNIIPVIIQCEPPTLSKSERWYQIPSESFSMSLKVMETYPISSYLDGYLSHNARVLTRDLEQYFIANLENEKQ